MSLGVVLETARRAQGLTQEQMAARVGITQASWSRYEKDMREPDDETLDRISAVLNLTPEFLRQAGKIRGALAVDAHMRRRKTAKPSDWRRLEARLNLYRLHARRVFDEIAIHAEQRIPSFDPFEIDPATAARIVRMQWRMPIGPVRNLIQWVEAAGCLVIKEDFASTGVDGLSQWIDECPVAMVNISAPTDRMRLTLAHELGHLCLHTYDVTETVEQDANAFGAEFLMPIEAIRPQLRNLNLGKLLDLKRQWGVSMQALIEHAYNNKLLTADKRTNFYKALSARGWRAREPGSDDLPPESPTLPESIGATLSRRGLSRDEVAQVVGLRTPATHAFLPAATHLRAL